MLYQVNIAYKRKNQPNCGGIVDKCPVVGYTP